MDTFSTEFRELNADRSLEILIIDRLAEDIFTALASEPIKISNIKAALFDFVVVTKLVKRIGLEIEIPARVKEIRDSIAHIDDRIERFNFKPAKIEGLNTVSEIGENGAFGLSITMNFQGANAETRFGVNGSVETIAPYAMINNYFIWLDRAGSQRTCKIAEILAEVKEYFKSISRN